MNPGLFFSPRLIENFVLCYSLFVIRYQPSVIAYASSPYLPRLVSIVYLMKSGIFKINDE